MRNPNNKNVCVCKEMPWGSVRMAKIEMVEYHEGTFLTTCISQWDNGTLGFCSARLAKTLKEANEDYQFFVNLMADVKEEEYEEE